MIEHCAGFRMPMNSNPVKFGFLGAAAVSVTIAELLLKRGAAATATISGSFAGLGTGALLSGWTWMGIVFYISSFICWLQVLRRLPLHLAFGLMSVVHALVPLGCWLFLGESIAPSRWFGIAIV